jgi:hypothetical protein
VELLLPGFHLLQRSARVLGRTAGDAIGGPGWKIMKACLADSTLSPPPLARVRVLCVAAGSLDGSNMACILLTPPPKLRHFAAAARTQAFRRI